MQRNWSKVKSGEKKRVRRPGDALRPTEPVKPSPLDKLPIEEQLVAATILDRQQETTPKSAVADINAFAAMLAQADAGMWGAARAMAEGQPASTLGHPYGARFVPDATPEPEPEPEPAGVVIITTPEPEPVADDEAEGQAVMETEFSEPEPEPAPTPQPTLKIVLPPEPEPRPEILNGVDIPEFDEALLAKMFANLAAHGMKFEDLS